MKPESPSERDGFWNILSEAFGGGWKVVLVVGSSFSLAVWERSSDIQERLNAIAAQLGI
jgi:hypothetical protein